MRPPDGCLNSSSLLLLLLLLLLMLSLLATQNLSVFISHKCLAAHFGCSWLPGDAENRDRAGLVSRSNLARGAKSAARQRERVTTPQPGHMRAGLFAFMARFSLLLLLLRSSSSSFDRLTIELIVFRRPF